MATERAKAKTLQEHRDIVKRHKDQGEALVTCPVCDKPNIRIKVLSQHFVGGHKFKPREDRQGTCREESRPVQADERVAGRIQASPPKQILPAST
jgi:uncharacterized C2H2 Zn-finger protein